MILNTRRVLIGSSHDENRAVNLDFSLVSPQLHILVAVRRTVSA